MEYLPSYTSNLYLAHYGLKGMKWGVRRFEDANGHLTPAGKRRYGIQDARKYYKINRLQRMREKTNNKQVKKILSGELRRTQTRSDRKHSDLSRADINVGREIVAKNRLKWAGFNTAAKAALTAAGAAYLYQNPETRAFAPLAVAGGAALTSKSAKKIPYYFMENRRYKQVNPKGATQKGLTAKQKRLRKIGKTALGIGATAAVAGTSAYLVSKAMKSKNMADMRSRASIATKAVSDANKQYSKTQKSDARKEQARNFAGYAKSTIGDAAKRGAKKVSDTSKRAAKAGGQRVVSSVKAKVTRDFDDGDPRSYTRAARNAVNLGREVVDKITSIRDNGPAAAVGIATEGIVAGTNKLIDMYKNRKLK